MNKKPIKNPNDDAQIEAKRILDRVSRESETVATSSMARITEQFKEQTDESSNFETEDKVEILGRRIGRSMGLVALVILVVYLAKTYVF